MAVPRAQALGWLPPPSSARNHKATPKATPGGALFPINNDIPHMDIREFREEGFLQEANRQFFHPLGLALETTIAPDGTEWISGVWDYRDDPHGIYFATKLDREKAEAIERLRREHWDQRCDLFDISKQDRQVLIDPDVQPLNWGPGHD